MDKQNMLYTYNEHRLGIKRNEILIDAITWMNLEGIMLSEISQISKDTYSIILFIRGTWNKQIQRQKE